MAEKQCKECGKTLGLDMFYKHPMMADGHLNKCKECTKSRVSSHRAKNLEKIRQYDKDRSILPHRREAVKKTVQDYRKRHPKRYKATNAVNNALRDGKLKRQPCEVCQATKAVAHHDDYNFPLQVRWLCQPCHKDWHKNNQVID